jgi:hypothetical protein
MTLNWLVRPLGNEGAAGVITMDVTVASLTVNAKMDDTLPTVALRTAAPGMSPVTLDRSVGVTKSATVGISLDQTT